MIMKTTSIILVFIAFLFASCNNNPVLPNETQVVLQGYLYTNQPVRDIQVMSSMAIGSSDTTDTPISNASVALLRNGQRFQLSASAGLPGYYNYQGNDLTVKTGDDFRIEVVVGGQSVTAETIVPSKPEQIALSIQTLRFQTDTAQSRFGVRTRVNSPDSAIVTWSNASSDYFYVVVESIDPARQLIRPDSTFTRRFVSDPTNQSKFLVNNNSILYTGRHVVRVYHVDKEYANLYRSRTQDSRTLNEPLTNVNNGLGIFSAFASDSLFFDVVLN
jgi:hypothetical protein